MKNRYQIIRQVRYFKISYIDHKKLNGFLFTPSNKIYHDGITVTKMTVVNFSFVEKILKRKIKRRLEVYLRFIASLVSDSDDSDITDLRAALNDITRYKSTIRFKYQKYLDQKYLALLFKKIELLEHELKTKIYYHKEKQEKVEENHRRR